MEQPIFCISSSAKAKMNPPIQWWTSWLLSRPPFEL
jgi:hypothetical protein